MSIDPDEFWAELEKLGEDEVRKRLATERIYGADKRPLVIEWLWRKDQSRADSFNREQLSIARDAAVSARAAADAARDAADEAKEANLLAKQANTTARIAMVMAAIATIISIISVS